MKNIEDVQKRDRMVTDTCQFKRKVVSILQILFVFIFLLKYEMLICSI